MYDIYAPIARNLVYPLVIAKRRSKEAGYLKDLRHSQFLDPEELNTMQWHRMKSILDHAYQTIPFYRNRFEQAGITPAGICGPDDLYKIPILTKQDIQNHLDEMISNSVSREELISDRTGGSTGTPIEFYYDKDRHASRQAAAIRHNEWAGWNIGDRNAVLWAAPRDIPAGDNWKAILRRHLLDRQIILDAGSLTEKKMEEFTTVLSSFRPKILLAYSNTMAFYAKYIMDNNIHDLGISAIVCSAEVLTDTNRSLIESAFQCNVFNRYGCREFSVIASECDTHDGMHINAENLYVEFVNDGRVVEDGSGEIIVTDLVNHAMPLIRYEIGDVGSRYGGNCSCGRSLPRMQIKDGRTTDFILTTDGVAVSGVALSTYVIPLVPGLRKAQFIQDVIGHTSVHAVIDKESLPDSINTLRNKLSEFVGKRMNIDIQLVDKIQEEQSGKFRFVKSSLPPRIILDALSK